MKNEFKCNHPIAVTQPFLFIHSIGYRGALNPGRPAMLGVWTNGWKGRDERLLDLEQIGLPTFYRPTKSIDAMNAAFPDSGEFTEAQLQALPDYVRNFKCQGQIEKV